MNRKKLLSICICFCIVSACGKSSKDFSEEKRGDKIGATQTEVTTYEDNTYEEILEDSDVVSYCKKDEIESVEVIDSDNYILRCVLEDKEYIVQFDTYENTFIPYTILPELADVTGDGKADLIVNIRINGNNLCETLSDTYVYTESSDGLEEILYIEAGKLNLWDEQYQYNLGCSLSGYGELIFDACGPLTDTGEIEKTGRVILKYTEGEWKKQ